MSFNEVYDKIVEFVKNNQKLAIGFAVGLAVGIVLF